MLEFRILAFATVVHRKAEKISLQSSSFFPQINHKKKEGETRLNANIPLVD
jgi:hypothetical protein